MSNQNLTAQVAASITGNEQGIDVEAVVAEIGGTYGHDLASIDEIDSGEYWAIVAKHDATQN